MGQTVGLVLNALIAALAPASAILRFLGGEVLFPVLLLLLSALNALALILNLKQKGNRKK